MLYVMLCYVICYVMLYVMSCYVMLNKRTQAFDLFSMLSFLSAVYKFFTLKKLFDVCNSVFRSTNFIFLSIHKN